MFDYNTIQQQVIDSIETSENNIVESYDLDSIMDELRNMDVQSIDDIDPDTYWTIVENNAY